MTGVRRSLAAVTIVWMTAACSSDTTMDRAAPRDASAGGSTGGASGGTSGASGVPSRKDAAAMLPRDGSAKAGSGGTGGEARDGSGDSTPSDRAVPSEDGAVDASPAPDGNGLTDAERDSRADGRPSTDGRASEAGGPGAACSTDADCTAPGLHCGFLVTDGCAAKGKCLPPPNPQCNHGNPATCACDGTYVYVGSCTGSHLPDGYAPKPVLPIDPNASRPSAAGLCALNSRWCVDNAVQTCDATCHPGNLVACEFVCANGVCRGECKPGSVRCSANGEETCDTNGTWQRAGDCDAGPCDAGGCPKDAGLSG